MLAWLLRATILGAFALASLWAGYFAAHGQPLWATGGALVILFAHAGVLGMEFVLLRIVGRGNAGPWPTRRELLGAWFGEVFAATKVFCWQQPFRSTVHADHLPVEAGGRQAVVFVHGFVCNRGLWNPWMARLRRAGVPFVAINLEPVFGDIERYVPLIDAAVRRVYTATSRPPLVVAHSMGGLAARAWLRASADDDQIDGVVTIGTPHAGSWLARFGMSANVRQMRRGSPWLRTLAGQEPPSRYARFTCFYSDCDNIAFPSSTGSLPGADNRRLRGLGHVHLSFHPDVFAEVWRRVSDTPSEPASN